MNSSLDIIYIFIFFLSLTPLLIFALLIDIRIRRFIMFTRHILHNRDSKFAAMSATLLLPP